MNGTWSSTRARTLLTGIGAALAVAVPITLAVRARAADSPAPKAMVYGAYLENKDGTAVVTNVDVTLKVWDAQSGGETVCSTEAGSIHPVGGYFEVVLSEDCSAAVSANANLWVEPLINKTSLGRSALGAVPYAVVANHALSTDAAAPSGALAQQLSAMQADIADLKQRLAEPPTYLSATASEKVLIETTNWKWVGGTESTTVAPGRYSVFNTGRVYSGGTGCSVDCLVASVVLAACLKVGDQLTPGGEVIAEAPRAEPVSLPAAAVDSFAFTTKTANVQFGLCARRLNDAGYDSIVANVYSMVTSQAR